MKNKKVIIGLGTGRCGTQSLVGLLNQVPDTHIDHERFPIQATWLANTKYFERICAYLEQREENIVGDVSFYNLPYVYLFMERYKNIKFIGLRRDKEATLQSYDRKTTGRNHFSYPNTDHEHRLWDEKYPKFLDRDKYTAMSDYYDLYYGQTAYLEKLFPHKVRVFDMEDLNFRQGVQSIFDFLKIKFPHIDEHFINIHRNVTGETKTGFTPDQSSVFKRMIQKWTR
ncbi:MAG: hypothetical protein U5R06_24220 [candidate division KSB1 bacterium]|nr:hypothetical protein [candidate division KSB1 bacterium]